MKASELKLLELLELKPDEGRIYIESRRMLLWDADAFGHLRRELIETLGVARARPILRRFGFAGGYQDAAMSRERFAWESDAEWWLSCPAIQRQEGKAGAEAERVVIDRGTGRFDVEIVWAHSYEAEQHRRVFGEATEPVCWTLAGFASGFSTALMGEEVYVVEIECAATGHERCRAIGQTRRAWGESGLEHASDYEARPLTAELEAREAELRRQRRALRHRERELTRLGTASGVTTRSPQMERVLDRAHSIAKVDTPALIAGESGTGKERLARLIHEESPRVGGPFIAINCGAIPGELLEGELFGRGDGSGLLEAARGGTLFLAEIGEASPAVQTRLARSLEGSDPTDARVLAATVRDLAGQVDAGGFRADLLERLGRLGVELPPLRERPEDIVPLAREFASKACSGFDIEPKRLSPELAEALVELPWPGNVRELENAMERAVLLAGDRATIERADLGSEEREPTGLMGVTFDEVIPLADLEKRYVLEVLKRFDGNRTHTARALGIGANTLWRKLKAWGVPPARHHDSSP